LAAIATDEKKHKDRAGSRNNSLENGMCNTRRKRDLSDDDPIIYGRSGDYWIFNIQNGVLF